MAIWELESNLDLYTMLHELIGRYHSRLEEAKIVLYANDKNKNRANKIIIAEASKASSKMKASTNADFTIMVYMTPWSDLNMTQKRACLDHELCHCGVHFEPVKEAAGGTRSGRPRLKVVRDDYGRVQYTNEIKRNENGEPKWRLLPHDLEEFRDIVARHGIWDKDIQSFKEVLDRSVDGSYNSNETITPEIVNIDIDIDVENIELRSTD